MSIRKPAAIVALLLLSCMDAYEQTIDSITTLKKAAKKFTVIPMPVLAGSPTTGLMFGLAPGISFVQGNPATTSISNFLGSFIYTTKKQLLTSLRGNMFLDGDQWILTTDVRFNLNSQPTYGLSTQSDASKSTIIGKRNIKEIDDLFKGPSKEEMMGFTHFRLHQTALKRHRSTRFFYGVGYHLDLISNITDEQLDLGSTPPSITQHYQYQTAKNLPTTGYTLSGLSANLSFDSRDNVANPYGGQLATISWKVNPAFLGSTASSSILWLEYRRYIPLNKVRPRHLLALWTYGWFVTSGKVPYMFLPAIGWDMFSRSGRPYTQGRFRGEDLFYTETEWRFPLQKTKNKWGGVVFLNLSTASSRTENISLFNAAKLGYGGGLRYMLSEKNRVNIGIDYGRGFNGASGIFLNLNEYF